MAVYSDVVMRQFEVLKVESHRKLNNYEKKLSNLISKLENMVMNVQNRELRSSIRKTNTLMRPSKLPLQELTLRN